MSRLRTSIATPLSLTCLRGVHRYNCTFTDNDELSLMYVVYNKIIIKIINIKIIKAYPITGHDSPEGMYRYNSSPLNLSA
jgi:hypothetical protein